jgi:glutamate carboxypeptidase
MPSSRLAAALAPVLLAAALAAGAAPKPRLSPAERKILRAAEANNPEAERLLERVVDINSGTMNFEGVRQVGSIFRTELDALGFTTRWVDGESFHRAGHLVAERKGRGKHVLMIGHLDTVFEKDSPFQRFERLPGGKARGPGVIDMKGGDVILIQSLKALRAAGALDGLNVAVVMSGDEEKVGEPLSLARAALLDEAAGCEAAIGFEDGAGSPGEAIVARRGSTDWLLRVTGTPAHSSQIFRDDVGAGAVNETARILDEMYRRLSGQEYLTFSAGVALGGTAVDFDPRQARGTAFGKSNVVAGQAVVQGDLRTVSPEQLEGAKARMKQIVAAHLPRTTATIEFEDGYPPMGPTEGNTRLLGLYDQASRDLGTGPVGPTDPMSAGAADVAFAASKVRMALDGVGLMGRDDHTDRETADLATLLTQTQRAALLLYRLANE